MAASNEILRKIDQCHKVDARYSQSVQAHRDRQVDAVVGYLEGRYKPLEEWAGRKYRSVILNDPGNTFVSFKAGSPYPVPLGRWMGWSEKHWRISRAKYFKLTIEERATLECKEQVMRYVSKQWLDDYISFYHPKEYERRYWEVVSRRKGDYRRPTLKKLFPEGTERLEEKTPREPSNS